MLYYYIINRWKINNIFLDGDIMSKSQKLQVVSRLAEALDANLTVVLHRITMGDELRIGGADKQAVQAYYKAAANELAKADQLLDLVTLAHHPKTQNIHEELAQIQLLLSSEFAPRSKVNNVNPGDAYPKALLFGQLSSEAKSAEVGFGLNIGG